ncbi:MAG: hypothetical protein ACPGLV_03165 [Bacteroidia bacterium]
MPENNHHSNPLILTLEQMRKYFKGNLLGIKKQEVEDKLNSSALLADAIDGLNEVDNLDKIDLTIGELNRQIQLKSGAQKVIIAEEPLTANESAKSASNLSIYPIAASFGAIVIVSSILYWVYNKNSTSSTTNALAHVEETTVANDNKPNTTKGNNTLTTNNDTSKIDSNIKSGLLALNEFSADLETDKEKIERPDSKKESLSKPKSIAKDLKNRKTNSEKTIVETAKEPTESSANLIGNNAIENKGYTNEETLGVDSSLTLEDDINYQSGYKSKSVFESEKSTYKEAIDLLNDNNLDDALLKFKSVADDRNHPNKDDANWSIAQIYMKKGDARLAKKALRKVKNSPKYGTKAQLLLEQL